MLYHPSAIFPGLLKNNGISYISPAAAPVWVKLLMNKVGKNAGKSGKGLEIYV